MREAVSLALKEAMKSRDAPLTGTLRMMSAAIKERDIEARGKGKTAASDEELVATLGRMARQREESAHAYEAGRRPDLADKERAEIEVIRRFMPARMAEAEMGSAVEAAIADSGAASPRDMGRVMALLKERYAGRMDLGKASALVKGRLG